MDSYHNSNPFRSDDSDWDSDQKHQHQQNSVRESSPGAITESRIPAQQMRASTPIPTVTSALLDASATQSSQPQQQHNTIPVITGLKSGPSRRYVVYGETDDDLDNEDVYGRRRRPKTTQLINFWSSVIAQLLSLPVLVLSIYTLVYLPLSSALTISCSIGIVLGSISIIIEFLHCIPRICPRSLQWSLGRHVVLHFLIACFSILPYMQRQTFLGTLFSLHVIPACLFYAARARRESIPAKL